MIGQNLIVIICQQIIEFIYNLHSLAWLRVWDNPMFVINNMEVHVYMICSQRNLIKLLNSKNDTKASFRIWQLINN